MEEEMSTEPIDCNDSINERDEENSSPQLTVLTTVAFDYAGLPDPRSFDRMDVDNHNVELDDSNLVSSTTESHVFQQLPAEPVEQISNESEKGQQVDEPSIVDQSAIEQNVVDQSTTEQNIVDQSTIEQNIVDQSAMEQNIVDQSTMEQNIVDQSTMEQNIVDQSTVEQNIVDRSTVEQNIVDRSTVEQSIVEQNTSESLKTEPESPTVNDEASVPPHVAKRKPKSPRKNDKRSVSPNTIPGQSRYGRVRKQKLSADFVSVDRKSFAVLNSSSYEPCRTDSPNTVPKKEKPKRAHRRRLKYVVEGQSIIASKQGTDESLNSDIDDEIADDETSRSSLNTSAIKTYSRKGDGADEKQTTSHDSSVVTNFPELNWKVGDVAWAKIGCYPYWPSIVTLEYGSSIYVKPVGKQQSRLAVHVHFFGDKGRRSWVLTTSLMKYESKEQFSDLKRQFIKDKLRMRYFIIPPRIEDLWEKAVTEADTIMKLPIDERTKYYYNLYPMTQEMYNGEVANSSPEKSSPKQPKEGAKKRGRKRKILNDDKSVDCPASKKVKTENENTNTSSTEEKKEREPIDEHTKKRRAFMRRMNQILKQSNAASLPPKKRLKLQAKNEQAFNKLLHSTTMQKEQQPRTSQGEANASSSSLDSSRKNDLSVYDFESDEETDVFIGTYNSKFTPQILNKIEERIDQPAEEKPKVPSPSKLPVYSVPATTAGTTPSVEQSDAVASPELDSSKLETTAETTVVKRKVGRPKGSKNKIKLKRRRGRPPGVKNKPKIVAPPSPEEPKTTTVDSSSIEVQQQSEPSPPDAQIDLKNETQLPENVEIPKRKRGRPRKTPEPPLKRRGRPPLGLKNKIKSVTALQHRQKKILLAASSATVASAAKLFKRPRGRPRKHPIVSDGLPNQVTIDSSLSGAVNVTAAGESVLTRVAEKPKKSSSDDQRSILIADLSSDEEDAKSEEEKHSSAPQYRNKKAWNIFLGLKNEKVCQICLKAGDTIRCRGPCCGYFHVECDAKSEIVENESESAKPRRGRKRKSTIANSLVQVKIESNDDTEGDAEVKDTTTTETETETVSEDCPLDSEATPKNGVNENEPLDTEASLKVEVAQETVPSPDARSTDLTTTTTTTTATTNSSEIIETDRVTSTNTVVNGAASSQDEIEEEVTERNGAAAAASAAITTTTTTKINGDIDLESPENEISSSTGEKLNSKVTTNESVSGVVACNENEETCSSEASAESNNACARTNNGNGVEFYCKRCSEERLYPCFSCGKEVQDKTKETTRYTCYVVACGRTYHKECLKEWPQASWGTSSSIKESLRCPQHYCHTCNSENPAVRNKHCNEILVRCIKCPTSYHKRVHCLPAGTEVLSSSQIICPRHYEPPPGMKHAHLNATWCFICCIGGSLICCDECPMSFHVECLKLRPEEYEGRRYICDDCQTGRYILYGEIVWVKLGHYRWWPARVLFPFEIPENIQNLTHRRGEFVVQFFGSHDYNWVNRGRAFSYQEGDSGKKYCKRNSVDMSFEKAMAEAENAYKKLQLDKAARDEVSRLGLKPPRYVKIKANRPIGNAKIVEADIANLTACECDPNSEKPCAADSDCLNRMLLVECNPLVCKAGERCMNQVFEKRVYPPLMPYKTDKRGWGLKTLVDMKKGDFIIEYVGEMIDEEEYKRRVDIMHKKQEDNYYFLTIDNQRMLDAGPKGNVSRFMNHSCDPNCETQKWTVNGDTRIGLFAVKDIPANSELVFNYNLSTQGNEKRACLCGSVNCSGYIGVKAVKNGNSSTDEESRKKSGDDTRKRSAPEAGSDPNVKKKRAYRKKKFKKMKHLRLLKPGTGKLAAAKRTTDLRMKMKMKNRTIPSIVKIGLDGSPEKLQSESSAKMGGDVVPKKAQKGIVHFKNHRLANHPSKRRFVRQMPECSLLKSSTAVGTFSCAQSEQFFKQRDLFRKDPATSTSTASKEGDDEPYVERRGRKKTPKNDDEKKELFFEILKRRIEQKIKNMTVNEVDEKCFKCGVIGELLYCDNHSCPRGYHLPCVNKARWPNGRWLCPWHSCLVCSSRSRIIRCDVCVNAYCGKHQKGNIFEESEDKYSCHLHKSEKAIQAHFKSVTTMRPSTMKIDNGGESTEMSDSMKDDSTATTAAVADAKNLFLLADVIEQSRENELKQAKANARKRKISSTPKADGNVPSVNTTNDDEAPVTKNSSDNETNVVIKKARRISSTENTKKVSKSESETNVIRKKKISRNENDSDTATEKRRRSSRTETDNNDVQNKTKKISRKISENGTADKTKVVAKKVVIKKTGRISKVENATVYKKTKKNESTNDSGSETRSRSGDETDAVAAKTTKKISRTARKSIRSGASKSEEVRVPEVAATKSNTATDDDVKTETPGRAYSSDDEFVDVEVEVLNDSE